jgi:hypothetical protein
MSTMEVEYVATSDVAKEALWFRRLFVVSLFSLCHHYLLPEI